MSDCVISVSRAATHDCVISVSDCVISVSVSCTSVSDRVILVSDCVISVPVSCLCQTMSSVCDCVICVCQIRSQAAELCLDHSGQEKKAVLSPCTGLGFSQVNTVAPQGWGSVR